MKTFYTDDIDQLYTEIAGRIQQDFTVFLEGINAPDFLKNLYFDVELNQKRYKINLIGDPIHGEDLGLFQLGMKEATIQSTGGMIRWGTTSTNTVDDAKVERFITFDLQYKYTHTYGGSNGCYLYLPNQVSSLICYCIQTKHFLTHSEYIKLINNEN